MPQTLRHLASLGGTPRDGSSRHDAAMRFLIVCTLMFANAWPAAASCPEATPSALSLRAAMDRALCLDPQLAQAQTEVARQQAVLDETAAAKAWQLQLQAGPSLVAQQGSGRDTNALSGAATVVVSRTLSDGGLTQARIAQRERELAAARADLQSQRQDRLRGFVNAWADLREAQASRMAAMRALDSARVSAAAVRARLAAGTATQVESLSAASAQAQAERDVLNAQTAVMTRQGIVAERLGWTGDTALTLQADDSSVLEPLARAIGQSSPAVALDTHPQWLAQSERLRSRHDALQAARADEGANWSVSGGTGPNITRGNSALAGYETSRRWASEVSLTWSKPLSDGGARRSRTAQAQAALDGAAAQQASLERSLRENLWQQWNAWRNADAELRAAQAAQTAAQAAEAAQRGRYEAGAGTLADWISAQADLSSRNRQVAAAEQSVLRSAVGAAHALGRLQLEPQP
jgi:outer membrane protein